MATTKPIESVGAKRTTKGGVPQKYVLDEPSRRLILALYDSSPERIDELQRRLRVPRRFVHKWACELGVARKMEKKWTPADIDYLKRHFRKDSAEDIANHLDRSVSSVRYKANRLGLSQISGDCYSFTDVCEGLGCHHTRAKRWTDQGWLKGERRANPARNDPWTFTAKNIRDFIIAHPGEVDLRRVDKYWFIDILAGGNVGIGALDNPMSR